MAVTARSVALSVSEKVFMGQVVTLASVTGWACYHTYDSRRSPHGYPDLTLAKPGRLVVAELKSERGRVTLAQTRWLDLLASVPGVDAYLWRPSDWPEIEGVLGGR